MNQQASSLRYSGRQSEKRWHSRVGKIVAFHYENCSALELRDRWIRPQLLRCWKCGSCTNDKVKLYLKWYGATMKRNMYGNIDSTVPFGECLTNMERKGMQVDASLLTLKSQQRTMRFRIERPFLDWAATKTHDGQISIAWMWPVEPTTIVCTVW
jgi:hypothetical protein